MRTIYKFPLRVDDSQVVSMPKDAAVLCVQAQNDSPCLWALVDDEAQREDRTILIRGTGHNSKGLTRGAYLGTFQLYGGTLVFHVFEG